MARNRSRRTIPASTSGSARARAWAAASSMASGRPSASRQIRRAAASVSGPEGSAGCTRRARSTNSATASASRSRPLSGRTVSPVSPSATRLVTSTRSSGHPRSRSATSEATSSRTCSQLSSTSTAPARPNRSCNRSRAPRPGSSRIPHPFRTTGASAVPGRTGASSTKPCSSHAPPRATSPANRVFPLPPGPTKDTSRSRPISRVSVASSSTRPTNEDLTAGTSGESRTSAECAPRIRRRTGMLHDQISI